ncbi:hypothetical protein D3C86_1723110 [compost metagenome]
MSLFIRSIELGVGFRLNPPVSYTIPLPTSTIGALLINFCGRCSIMVKVGGSTLPAFTASIPPIFICSIFALPSTCTLKPPFLPICCSSLPNCSAVRYCRGSLIRSLARHTASTIVCSSFSSLTVMLWVEKNRSCRLWVSFLAVDLYFRNW